MHQWKYKNLTFLFFSCIFAYFVLQNEALRKLLFHLGNLGYLGAFLGGMLFVSTFTVATGIVILFILAESLSPLEVSLFAGLGGVVGDLTIFCLIKNNLAKEMKALYGAVDKHHHLQKLLHTKYFSWTLPVAGALIIASPLPDEIGISLMGISRLKVYQFILISFILNTVGIFIIISSSTLF